MRTGPDLIRATKPFAFDQTMKSWWYVLSTGSLMLASFAGALWNVHPLARLVCGVLAGLFMLRLFVIYHDQQHHAILPRSRLAEALMRLLGILVLSPSSIWRSSHNYHHTHNSKLRSAHIGSFPIMTKAHFLASSKARRARYLFMRHPLTILFGYIFLFLHGMCLYPFWNDRRKHLDSLAALCAHVAIGAVLTWSMGWPALVFAQIIPYFIACAFGAYLFYAQHNFPGVSFRDKAGWTYERAALESSSFLKTGRLMAWFTGNIGYHHIHHLNARIPFYRLPEAMRAIPEVQTAKTISLSPRDIFRCLRLKAWDVEAQRMVSLREMRANPKISP